VAENDMTEKLKALSALVDKRANDYEAKIGSQKVDAPEGAEGSEPAGDIAPIVSKLGVDEEKAKMILECAKDFDWLKDMSPQDLADHLFQNAGDMQMIMMEVARKQDAASESTIQGDVYDAGTTGTTAI
tara:strand:+ start:611 stop:997 length:387 start_codon:yes stop_codon:yes gene_type:complete